MPVPAIALVVGLGNPGPQYRESRHNAGVWFVDALQVAWEFRLRESSRYKGLIGDFSFAGHTIRVLAPQTFMNRSGDSVTPLVRFFRIPAEQVLIAHDELDLPAGVVRFKHTGGHGGHKGLQDIIRQSATQDMKRLRFGIGHPGHRHQVSDYVLTQPSPEDRVNIHASIDRAVAIFPDLLVGNFSRAMQLLHTA